MSRDELIPAYSAAARIHEEARRAETIARDNYHRARSQLFDASYEEAKDQLDRVLTLSDGRKVKITGLGAHWLDASVLYPIYVEPTKTGWGKRCHHGYGLAFNFELRHWEQGTVTAEDGFKPARNVAAVKAEAIDA